jgi:hypothetical protein
VNTSRASGTTTRASGPAALRTGHRLIVDGGEELLLGVGGGEGLAGHADAGAGEMDLLRRR